ncbi:MAG: hypothetical protein JWO08_3397, partial [Verrucomicrobiaceae bacterium]|nr:hypothetical protein [Verrucomicrobiaceae bacterium]
MDFHFFNARAEVDVAKRNLPHWEQLDAYYFITFRTADSIPEDVLHHWYHERDVWLAQHGIDSKLEDWQRDLELLPEEQHNEFYRLFTAKWHEHLDQGHGECPLWQPDVSAIVAESFRHFDGDRYELDSFVVMPNHVHVLLGVAGRGAMRRQCRNWKKYTATQINERLGRSGQFWQWESFDHLVRSAVRLAKFREYVVANPMKAKLKAGEYALYVKDRSDGT